MKPAWDKLMKEFKNSKSTLIADVDCTAGGQKLCETVGVRGYPTIKHGDPNSLEDYNGGRDFAAMKKFAEGLKPSCSPFNLEICSGEEKTKIEELMKLPAADLTSKIKAEEAKLTEAEETFKAEVEKLQKKYESLSKEKDDTIAKVKADGLGLMKAVEAKKGKDGDSDKEEL
jgi:hypothetical protein